MRNEDKDFARREGAMRIFGALSGVDEDYLAACESPKAGNGQSVYGLGVFARRYGGLIAAAMFLAVIGAGWLIVQTASKGESMNNSPAVQFKEDAAPMMQDRNDEAVYEGEAAEAPNGAAAEADGDGIDAAVNQEAGAIRDDFVSVSKSESEMTLEQAAELKVVGDYLPKVFPSHGEITRITGDSSEGAEKVALSWSYANQWDTFLLTVQNLGSELPSYIEESIADIDKPEEYDENMYEIPYAETVPKEYHIVFQDPVFEEDVFDKDCVKARIVSHTGDSGDTDTPRGMFGVLYRSGDNYVLVRFNGRGSVDEIWDMMSSIGG